AHGGGIEEANRFHEGQASYFIHSACIQYSREMAAALPGFGSAATLSALGALCRERRLHRPTCTFLAGGVPCQGQAREADPLRKPWAYCANLQRGPAFG